MEYINVEEEQECQDCKKFTWQQKLVLLMSLFTFITSIIGTIWVVKSLINLL